MKNLNRIILSICFFVTSLSALNAAPITVFIDDGSGFNPNTSVANNWVPNPTWSIGSTVQDIADLAVYSGSQAATDMVNTLGATNQIISVGLSDTITVRLDLIPFVFTTPERTDVEFSFSQTAVNFNNSPSTHLLFDNFRIDVEDVIGGLDAWLWMDMYIIQEVLVLENGRWWTPHRDEKANGAIIDDENGTFHSGTLTPGIVFINIGSVHAHATFLDGEPIGIRSDAFASAQVSSPSTLWLILVALGIVFYQDKIPSKKNYLT